MRLRSQTRLLPAAAVNEALEERSADFREPHGQRARPSGETPAQGRGHAELMPRALLKSERVGASACSRTADRHRYAAEAQAERFLDKLRDSLGSLQVTPLKFKQPVGSSFTGCSSATARRNSGPAANAACRTWPPAPPR
jgi:recombination associated protein RdgC